MKFSRHWAFHNPHYNNGTHTIEPSQPCPHTCCISPIRILNFDEAVTKSIARQEFIRRVGHAPYSEPFIDPAYKHESE